MRDTQRIEFATKQMGAKSKPVRTKVFARNLDKMNIPAREVNAGGGRVMNLFRACSNTTIIPWVPSTVEYSPLPMGNFPRMEMRPEKHELELWLTSVACFFRLSASNG